MQNYMIVCFSFCSSGQPAFAGFQERDGVMLYSLPGSGTEQILLLSNTSNVGETGVWVYRIDDSISIEPGGLYIFCSLYYL